MRIVPLNKVEPSGLDWVIQDIWAGVGIIGGTPKTKKTFLALEIAKSVSSGAPLFNKYRVPNPGPVIYFAGEDNESDLARRMPDAPKQLYVCTDKPKLDRSIDRIQLSEEIALLKPRLIILDPFVRFHTSSENHVTGILDYLRSLNTPTILVHHMRKGGTGGAGLRGSGDLHAWGDSNIYVRSPGEIELEFRHAPGRVERFQTSWTGVDETQPFNDAWARLKEKWS